MLSTQLFLIVNTLIILFRVDVSALEIYIEFKVPEVDSKKKKSLCNDFKKRVKKV